MSPDLKNRLVNALHQTAITQALHVYTYPLLDGNGLDKDSQGAMTIS